MKAYSYKRKKQFTEEIEYCIGVFDEIKSAQYTYVKIFHPIINGVVWRGIFHTNAYNITEVDIEIPIDGATGKALI